jgi:hypothetical protein
MSRRIIGVHQPNFLPWIGYFKKMVDADVFVFYDDVQFPKGSYSNRVKFCFGSEPKWVTASVLKHSSSDHIKDIQYQSGCWKSKSLRAIKTNYAKAPFFHDIFSMLESIFDFPSSSLVEFNINAIDCILKELGISVNTLRSSSMGIETHSTDKLIDIIKNLKGTHYLSGRGGDNYQTVEEYSQAGIQLLYNDVQHLVYKQFNRNVFMPGLSIIDALFNHGEGVKSLLLEPTLSSNGSLLCLDD